MLRDLFVFGGIPTLLLYYGDESLSRKNSHLWGGCPSLFGLFCSTLHHAEQRCFLLKGHSQTQKYSPPLKKRNFTKI